MEPDSCAYNPRTSPTLDRHLRVAYLTETIMATIRQTLPDDIMLMVFEEVDDISTLSSLTEAHPFLLMPLLERRFETLVPNLLQNLWSEELCQYVYAILLAEQEPPTNLQYSKAFFRSLLEGSEPRAFPPNLPRTLRTLERIVSLKETIDFFVPFCTLLFLNDFPSEIQMLLSAGEELRIQRALLRFQLYTQLFHQPGATDEIVSDRDWEQRYLVEQYFWTRFESVEVEECKCIYAVLYNTLTYMHNQLLDTPCSPEKSTQRGLLLLRPVFSGASLSPLMSSYAQRFVNYAFTGLHKVDPFDGNFFLTYPDIESSGQAREKRYLPSDRYRERNFGVKMIPIYHWPTKYHRIVRVEDRTGWRLIGYCFWDKVRVAGMRKRMIRWDFTLPSLRVFLA